MPKPRNPKCELCAKMSAEQAQILHGPDGDNCWKGQRCHNRRSHYRRLQATAEEVESIEISTPDEYFALLYVYRSNRESPVHSIRAELWKGQKPIAEASAHTFGLTASKIRQFTEEALKQFSAKAKKPLSQFRDSYDIDPKHCPVRPSCPLHPERNYENE